MVQVSNGHNNCGGTRLKAGIRNSIVPSLPRSQAPEQGIGAELEQPELRWVLEYRKPVPEAARLQCQQQFLRYFETKNLTKI